MVDTSPPRTQLRGPKNYYKNGHRYADGFWPCEKCIYADNSTCKECCFAVWNVDGIREGFLPSEAHRRAHPEEVTDAIRGSPLMEKFSSDAVEDRRYRMLHTEVGPPGSGLTMDKYIDLVIKGAQEILDQSGFASIRVTGDKVKQVMGHSPIETGSPQTQTLPLAPTGIPHVPHGNYDPSTQSTVADPGDVNRSLRMIYEARRTLDH